MAYNYSDSGYVYSGTLSDSSIYSDEKSDSDIITLTKTIGNTLIIDDSFWIMTVNASNVKKSGCANAAERRSFVSTLINTLYPGTSTLTRMNKKRFR